MSRRALALGAVLLACGGHGQPVERERADRAFVLHPHSQPSPSRLLPAPPERVLLPFPQDRLRILDTLPLPWLDQLPTHLADGPQVLTVSQPAPPGLAGNTHHELLLFVEDGDLRGWMPIEELPPGLYRLRDWWIVFDGRWLERARRYPEDLASVQRTLERTSRRPDERDIRQHLRAGTELIETKWVGQPARSPYVPGSSFPEDIRAIALQDVERGFERYAAILHDPRTPVVGLEVVTNSRQAAPYFLSLIRRFGIPGRVVLHP